MHPLTIFIILHSVFSAGVASAERSLPTDLQFDLVFPRNETYAPTQFFPIVIGVQNIDSVWPLELDFSVVVRRSESDDGETQTPTSYPRTGVSLLSPPEVANAVGPTPGKHFFHHFSINMTNGTTGQFRVEWSVAVVKQCFANHTDPRKEHDGNFLSWQPMLFSTAPGGKVPDIEATINSCPEPNNKSSVAVRVSEVKQLSNPDPASAACPVLDTSIAPTSCGYKEAAASLAANVSSAILHRMGCKGGTWQNMTGYCSEESGAMSWRGFEFGTGWALLVLSSLALASI